MAKAQKTLHVDHLIIGNPRYEHARLTSSGLIFYGPGGSVKFSLVCTHEGTTLALRDGNSCERIRLDIGDDGTPSLSLSDANGQDKITATIDADGSPWLSLRDSQDQPRLSLALLENDEPSVALYSRDEKLRLHLLCGEDGQPELLACPPTGTGMQSWGGLLDLLTRTGPARPPERPCACDVGECAHTQVEAA